MPRRRTRGRRSRTTGNTEGRPPHYPSRPQVSPPTQDKYPRVFYRGTKPGSSKHISTGDDYWDNRLFMSSSKKLAESYGENIEVIVAKEDAKILYEDTSEFKRVAGRSKTRERYLTYLSRVLRNAENAGYDAVHFKRQGDVGTAVINPDKFIRNRG